MGRHTLSHKRRILPFALVVFLGYVGFALPLPVLPEMFLDPERSILPHSMSIQAKTIWLGFVMAAYPLGQFFGCPILGRLSDRFGRKKVILTSLFGNTLGYIITAFAAMRFSPEGIFAGLLLCGFCEGNVAIAQAVISDLADTSEKVAHFGWLNLFTTFAFFIGPLMGGFLADPSKSLLFSFATPFWVASAMTVIAAAIVYFMAKESVPKLRFRPKSALFPQDSDSSQIAYSRPSMSICEESEPAQKSSNFGSKASSGTNSKESRSQPSEKAGFIGALRQSWKNHALRRIFSANFFIYLGIYAFWRYFPVFLERRFDFTSSELAYVMAFEALAYGVGLLTLTRLFAPRKSIVVFSLLLAAMLAIAVIPRSAYNLLWTVPLIGAFLAVVMTNIAVAVSDSAGREVQGQTMGALQSVQVCAELAVTIGGAWAAAEFPALPLTIGAAMTAIGGLLILRRKVGLA